MKQALVVMYLRGNKYYSSEVVCHNVWLRHVLKSHVEHPAPEGVCVCVCVCLLFIQACFCNKLLEKVYKTYRNQSGSLFY